MAGAHPRDCLGADGEQNAALLQIKQIRLELLVRFARRSARPNADPVQAILADNPLPQCVIQIGNQYFACETEYGANMRHLGLGKFRQSVGGGVLPKLNHAIASSHRWVPACRWTAGNRESTQTAALLLSCDVEPLDHTRAPSGQGAGEIRIWLLGRKVISMLHNMASESIRKPFP